MKKKVYLTLQNGDVFEGFRFGADGEISGELVFSTNMVGYVETLTDPSNLGKMVVQTFPLIGNYGVMPVDAESDRAWVSAYIVREVCEMPSNFRSEGTLDEYLKKMDVIGVCGIDTRQLTKILRENGVMNAYIGNKPLDKAELVALAEYKTKDCVKKVAPTAKTTHGNANAKYTVALWDFGSKKSSINYLTDLGCKVIDMPFSSTAEEILSCGADGVVIGEGPGDPKENAQAVTEIKKVIGKLPVFGVGLGHQLVALALDAKTEMMKYGHRGGNQPVKCLANGKVYISTQNHGYVVVSESVKQGKISYVNVNDNTCEGIDYDDKKAFTLQFVPESCFTGLEANPSYEKFFAMMEKEKKNA